MQYMGARARSSCRKSTSIRLSILNPSKLTKGDIVDLSGVSQCVLLVDDPSGKRETTKVGYKAFGSSQKGNFSFYPFPPATKGTFYFHNRTSVNPVAGEIRFRVLPMAANEADNTSGAIPDLFSRGWDLIDHSGLFPWHISLLSILYARRPALRALMKKEGYITEAAEEEVERMRLAHSDTGREVHGLHGQTVEQFTDNFVIKLSTIQQSVMFLTKEGILPTRLMIRQMTTVRPMLPSRERASYHRHPSYSGTILARFEMIQRKGRNRVVIRVLKFIKPPNASDLVVQEEGALLKKFNPVTKLESVWEAGARTQYITPSSLKLLEEKYLPKSTA